MSAREGADTLALAVLLPRSRPESPPRGDRPGPVAGPRGSGLIASVHPPSGQPAEEPAHTGRVSLQDWVPKTPKNGGSPSQGVPKQNLVWGIDVPPVEGGQGGRGQAGLVPTGHVNEGEKGCREGVGGRSMLQN